MVSRFSGILLVVLFSVPALAGNTIHFADGKDVQELKIQEKLKNPPAEWKAPLVMENLGRTDMVSSHLVWIKTHENLHYHATHEGTVVLLKGHGHFRIGDQNIALKPGDVVTIPRGVVHAFTNESKGPAAAYVIFAPPFDGKDVVEVGEQVQ